MRLLISGVRLPQSGGLFTPAPGGNGMYNSRLAWSHHGQGGRLSVIYAFLVMRCS